MKNYLDTELKRLTKKLVKMADMVQSSLNKAMKAVLEQDVQLAKKVIKEDEKINAQEVKVENLCLEFLALYQPAAIDLRFVTMTLRINNDLERIADLSVNIAERAIDIKSLNFPESLQKIAKMADIASRMVSDAVTSFVDKDTNLAKKVCRTDDKVDKLHEETFNLLLSGAIKDPRSSKDIISLLFISKNIERIADHADNIGEDVVYITKGKSIRHQ